MRDRSQGFPCPVQHQLATGCVTSAAPRASSSHWPGSSADGCRRGRSPITIPQPSPAALRRTGERGRVPDLRRCAVIRLRHPATEANASSRLATFQQLVTTPTVKEHPASSLQNNPICAISAITWSCRAPIQNERRISRAKGCAVQTTERDEVEVAPLACRIFACGGRQDCWVAHGQIIRLFARRCRARLTPHGNYLSPFGWPRRLAVDTGTGVGSGIRAGAGYTSPIQCAGSVAAWPGRLRKPGVGSVEWMGLPFSPFLADSLKPIRAGRR
jgi:hypothetical protein